MHYIPPICTGSNNEHRMIMTPKHMTPDVNYYASRSSAVNIMFQCEKCFTFKLIRYKNCRLRALAGFKPKTKRILILGNQISNI